jgi:hypothetical protein
VEHVQRRLAPFHDLDIGTRVVLVSGGGPLAGVLTWEVEVVQVVKDRYSDHEHAWQLIRPLGRLVKPAFMQQPYTLAAPPSGWLLAWAYTPIRQIMEPRSPEHHIGRNGWGVTNALRVGGGGNTGQARMSDPLLRRKVELAAMSKVHDWLRERGHSTPSIHDTSANHPYDYEVGPAHSPQFRVEVKGTTGQRGPLTVTAGEVRSAREGGVRTVLAVVHDIELTLQADGTWEASGGQVWVDKNWRPADETLQPTEYRHHPDYGK